MKDELTGLRRMLEQSAPGDVLALTALGQRPEIFAYLKEASAVEMGPARVRELVRSARLN
jgi:hypothetical protein